LDVTETYKTKILRHHRAAKSLSQASREIEMFVPQMQTESRTHTLTLKRKKRKELLIKHNQEMQNTSFQK
jgi:hypothetical protein